MARSNKTVLSEAHVRQINVLKTMSKLGLVSPDPRPFDIGEIATLTGLRDEREIQRYLFILEGQKLVSPHPEGDFTSKTWQITKHGLEAVKTFQEMA